MAQWLALRTTDRGVPGSRLRCGLEEVTFTPCIVLVKPERHGRTTGLDRL